MKSKEPLQQPIPKKARAKRLRKPTPKVNNLAVDKQQTQLAVDTCNLTVEEHQFTVSMTGKTLSFILKLCERQLLQDGLPGGAYSRDGFLACVLADKTMRALCIVREQRLAGALCTNCQQRPMEDFGMLRCEHCTQWYDLDGNFDPPGQTVAPVEEAPQLQEDLVPVPVVVLDAETQPEETDV